MLRLALILGALALVQSASWSTSNSRYVVWTKKYTGAVYQCGMKSVLSRNTIRYLSPYVSGKYGTYWRLYACTSISRWSSHRNKCDFYRKQLDKAESDIEKFYPRTVTTAQAKTYAQSLLSSRLKSLAKYANARKARESAVKVYNTYRGQYKANLETLAALAKNKAADMKKIAAKAKEEKFTKPHNAFLNLLKEKEEGVKKLIQAAEKLQEVMKEDVEIAATRVRNELISAEAQVVEQLTRQLQVKASSGIFSGLNYSPIKKCDKKQSKNVYGTWACVTLVYVPAVVQTIWRYSHTSTNNYFGTRGKDFMYVKYSDVNRKGIRALRMRTPKSFIQQTVHMEGEFQFPWTAAARKTAAPALQYSAKCKMSLNRVHMATKMTDCLAGIFTNPANRKLWSSLMASTYRYAYWNRYFKMPTVSTTKGNGQTDMEKIQFLQTDLNLVLRQMGNMLKYTYLISRSEIPQAYAWSRYCSVSKCSYFTSSISKEKTVIDYVPKYQSTLKAFYHNNMQIQELNRNNDMFQYVRSITLAFHTLYTPQCSSVTSSSTRRYRCGGSGSYTGYSKYDHVGTSAQWLSVSGRSGYFTADAGAGAKDWNYVTYAMRYVAKDTFYGKEYKLQSPQQDFANGNTGLEVHTNKKDNDHSSITHTGWYSNNKNDGTNGRTHVATGEDTFEEFAKKFPDLFNSEK